MFGDMREGARLCSPRVLSKHHDDVSGPSPARVRGVERHVLLCWHPLSCSDNSDTWSIDLDA